MFAAVLLGVSLAATMLGVGTVGSAVVGVVRGLTPPEVAPLTPVLHDLGVIVKDSAACVRDPTQVLHVNGTWHFWATHNPACADRTEFPRATVHHYFTVTNNVTGPWNTSGEAVGPGPLNEWDAWSVFTPGAIYDASARQGEGLWYLWYGAVANGSRPTRESIGLVTSSSPFGPWIRSPHNPVFAGSATPWCGGAGGGSARVDEADAYVIGGNKLIVVKGVCTNFTALPTVWISTSTKLIEQPGAGGRGSSSGSFDPPYAPMKGAAPMALAAPTASRRGFEQARLFPGPDGMLHMTGHDHGDNLCPHYVSASGGVVAADWRRLAPMASFGLSTNEATPVFAGVPGDMGGVPTHFIQFSNDHPKHNIHLLSVSWINGSAIG
eukprot:m.11892 g.11892  ORF g.11892 m.11892 type:complete len:380 (-) comp7564_c0_seq1:395-1534(-)